VAAKVLAEVVSLETDWVSRLDVEGSCMDPSRHRPKIHGAKIGERKGEKKTHRVSLLRYE
jgi:hypothetical protein